MSERGMFTLVIMAAGLGRRFGGDKQLAAVGPTGEAFIDYAVADAAAAGASRIVIVVRSDIEADIRRHMSVRHEALRRSGIKFHYVSQDRHGPVRAKPWGTAHAVLCAVPVMSAQPSAFFVCNADDYYGSTAFAALADTVHDLSDDEAGLCGYRLGLTLPDTGSVNRGVCDVGHSKDIGHAKDVVHSKDVGHVKDAGDARAVGDPEAAGEAGDTRAEGVSEEDTGGGWRLKGIVEHLGVSRRPDGTIRSQEPETELDDQTVVSMNLWAFPHAALDWIDRAFQRFVERDPDSNAECLLPVVVAEQMAADRLSVRVVLTDESWIGVTSRADLEVARAALSRRPIAVADGAAPPS